MLLNLDTFLSQGLRPLPPAPFGFSGLPFGGLGASFVTFWERFWHLGSSLGWHFDISGTPWDVILAPRDQCGRPWEQQDGFEVSNNMIFDDFGMMLGFVYVSFWSSKCLKIRFFCRACFQVIYLSISESKFQRLGFPNQGFRIEGIPQIGFSWKSRLMNFGIDFRRFLTALGTVF